MCVRPGFAGRQDAAIVRLLLYTGMRRTEITHLKLADIDFEPNVARMLGKGRRPRACPFGRKTAQALDRYLRAWSGHKEAHRAELWLGLWGPMTESGVDQMLEKRANRAKLGPLHTPSFRHSLPTRGSPKAARKPI